MTIEAQSPPLAVDADGVIRVGGTRVTLDTVIGAYLDGASADSIAEAYPTVTLADVYGTIGYYLKHRQELDQYLQQRELEGEKGQREIESRPDHRMLRDRLLARARQQGLRP